MGKILFCSKCGNRLNEGEQFCGKCGQPVNADRTAKSSAKEIQRIPPVSSIAGPGSGRKESKSASIKGKIAGIVSEVLSAAAGYGNIVQEKLAGWKPGIAEGSSKRYLYAGLGAMAAVVLVLANGARINHALHKTFSSPADYYQYIEKKTIEEFTSDAGEWYDRYVLYALNPYDRKVSAELEVELGEDGQEFLGLLGLTGIDVSWLKSVSVSGEANVKEDMMAFDAALNVNKTDLLSGSMMMDIGKEAAYVQIPEINGKYISFDSSALGYDGFDAYYEQQKRLEALLKACPNRKEAEKLLRRYLKTVLECMDDVEISKETISAEGIEQKCTALKVVIDSETVADIAKAVLKEARDDKEIKAIILDLVKAGEEEMDAEEIYSQLQEQIDELLDLPDQSYDTGEKLVMKVYVDGKGAIRGRSLAIGPVTVKYLMPEKGRKYGCEWSAQMGEMKVKLAGSGKRSGDAISGDFNIKYNGASIVDITVKKLNLKDLRKGQPNGGVTVQLSSKISSLIGQVPGLSIAEDLKLSADFDSRKHSHACRLGVTYDDQDLGNISLAVKTGSGSGISTPDRGKAVMIEEGEDLIEWTESIDAGKLFSSMKKAGLPSEYTDMLEEAFDDVKDADYSTLISMMYHWF